MFGSKKLSFKTSEGTLTLEEDIFWTKISYTDWRGKTYWIRGRLTEQPLSVLDSMAGVDKRTKQWNYVSFETDPEFASKAGATSYEYISEIDGKPYVAAGIVGLDILNHPTHRQAVRDNLFRKFSAIVDENQEDEIKEALYERINQINEDDLNPGASSKN